MTAAFASSAALIVGRAARMRASLVTTPSATGTFRSSRIRTRLPARSRSDILVMAMPRSSCGLLCVDQRDGRVEHAVREAPLVVVPRDDLNAGAVNDLGQRRVVSRRRRVVI